MLFTNTSTGVEGVIGWNTILLYEVFPTYLKSNAHGHKFLLPVFTVHGDTLSCSVDETYDNIKHFLKNHVKCMKGFQLLPKKHKNMIWFNHYTDFNSNFILLVIGQDC